jgi:CRP-like cAMP-binding protein
LKGAPLGDIDSVQGVSELVTYEPGQVIVKEGDTSQDIMVVIAGRVRVEKAGTGTVDELRVGAMIGEIAFLDRQPRTASLVAVNEAKLLVIPAAKLQDLLRERKELAVAVYRNAAMALCQRLRAANQQIEALSPDSEVVTGA